MRYFAGFFSRIQYSSLLTCISRPPLVPSIRMGHVSFSSNASSPDPWYKSGLKFKCTACGQCCSGSEGSVSFNDQEGKAIASRLNISFEKFLEDYTRLNRFGQRSLKEVQVPEHGLDCVFLDRTKQPGKALCSVYDVRPRQCRTWPFWSENLEHAEAWAGAGKDCPGINTGKSFRLEQIREVLEMESQ